MQVVYATESAPRTFSKSLFLAGPSPRRLEHTSWRVRALEILAMLGYDGVVFIPLPRDGQWPHSYEAQVDWETKHLKLADKVVFWCPRDLTVCEDVLKGKSAEKAMNLPAFTTNVEFGLWVNSGKAVLGYPKDARKLRYLQVHADSECVPTAHTLTGTLMLAVADLGEGAERIEGEREVPFHIWKLPHFQSWYTSQTNAGNRLDGADLLWNFRVGPTKGITFAYVLHVNVYVASEDRNKTNEFLFGRPDIACIVAYSKAEVSGAMMSMAEHTWHERTVHHLLDTEVALIREFRSPARTADGFLRELPGGSSLTDDADSIQNMTHELEEETGLGAKAGFEIDPSRLRKIGSRQLAGTLSVHQAHVFAVELLPAEMAYLKQQEADNVVHGVVEDTERTYVEVHRLGDLLDSEQVDWSMLGMIFTALSWRF